MTLRARLARRPPGYRFTIGRILAIYAGLMVTLLLAALDQTIVATALPRIVSDVGGLDQYSWVFTSYMLATTVTVPLYGKLGDIYGRRPLFIVAIYATHARGPWLTAIVVYFAYLFVAPGGRSAFFKSLLGFAILAAILAATPIGQPNGIAGSGWVLCGP